MAEVSVSPPFSPPHINNHKRVSFGENPVKTFIYEKEDDTPHVEPLPPRVPFTDYQGGSGPRFRKHPHFHRSTRTPEHDSLISAVGGKPKPKPKVSPWSPTAPASRVRVREERSDVPQPIAPPNQIEERHVVSPTLRSQRMDELENPFKPEDHLYHEVDPIVEQYLHKPFPPSLPGSTHGTPVKQNGQSPVNESLQNSSSPAYFQNGLTKNDLLPEEEKANEPKGESQPLIEQAPAPATNGKKASDGDLPAPAQVELVHIKKKKCGCCSLQ